MGQVPLLYHATGECDSSCGASCGSYFGGAGGGKESHKIALCGCDCVHPPTHTHQPREGPAQHPAGRAYGLVGRGTSTVVSVTGLCDRSSLSLQAVEPYFCPELVVPRAAPNLISTKVPTGWAQPQPSFSRRGNYSPESGHCC